MIGRVFIILFILISKVVIVMNFSQFTRANNN
jgi:hypothetical protein